MVSLGSADGHQEPEQISESPRLFHSFKAFIVWRTAGGPFGSVSHSLEKQSDVFKDTL